jgi:diguanylate cyclase (GGDEF)-like protein
MRHEFNGGKRAPSGRAGDQWEMATATPVQERVRKPPQAPLLDQLQRLFAKAKLPSSPALASRILSLADDPDTAIEQFAAVIQMDGALAARLLKMANAAYMAMVTPATTIQRAVTVLGLGRVRTAALGFQLVGHLNKLGGQDFDIKAYWRQSLLRGCVGRELAGAVLPSLAEEAFLVGLLCDGGILLLVQLLGAEYAKLYETGQMSPSDFHAAEKEKFPYTHVDAISAMADEWNLPDVIRKPLACQHRPTKLKPGATPLDRLCALTYLIGSFCFTEDLSNGASGKELLRYAQDQFGLCSGDVQKCLAAAGDTYKHSSELLGESLPDDADVTDLLGEANRQLMAVAGEAEIKVLAAEAQRDQIRSSLGEYRERAARDPLTGLLNRGALTDVTAQHLSNSREKRVAITCLFLDMDNFKDLNDEYGHQTGDLALKAVAHAMPQVVVNAGAVGRYGGEEFVLVIPGLSADDAAAKARQVLKLVRSVQFKKLGLKKPVTCSVGGVWGMADHFENPEALFAAADEQMYIAKKSGKDRSSCKAIGRAAPIASTSQPPTNSVINVSSAKHVREAAINDAVGQTGVIHTHSPIPALYRRIAERLNREKPSLYMNIRKQNRTELLTHCTIHVISGSDCRLLETNAFVRNISTTGIGLLAAHPLSRGDAVEVAIHSQNNSFLYVAGLVAFCRHIEGPAHEIGIQLTYHANEPIFSKDPKAAIKQLGWLAEALGSRQSSP